MKGQDATEATAPTGGEEDTIGDTPSDASPPWERHPAALGVERYYGSPFVTESSNGLSITSVLLVEGPAAVAELERLPTKDRPAVFCPFCGRRGKYHKNRKVGSTRIEFFSHGQGQEECVQADLWDQLHARVIELLKEQLGALAREGGALAGQVHCRRCNAVMNTPLIAAGGWDRISLEHTLTDGQVERRPDLVLMKGDDEVFAIEVAKTSYVDAARRRDLKRLGVAGIELRCRQLVNREGQPIWSREQPLPEATSVWLLEEAPAPFHICPKCRALSEEQRAVARLVEGAKGLDEASWRRFQAWVQRTWGDTGDVDAATLPSVVVEAPELLRESAPTVAARLAGRPRHALYDPLELALHLLGFGNWGWFKGENLVAFLSAPYGVLAPRLADAFYRSENPSSFNDWLERGPLGMADEVARHLGQSREQEGFEISAILEALSSFVGEGHTAFRGPALTEKLTIRLGVHRDAVREQLGELLRRSKLVRGPDRAHVALPLWANAEENIAKWMGWRSNQAPTHRGTWPQQDLDPDQTRVLNVALRWRASIITGGAGTGKTTMIRQIIESTPEAWMLLAPTGRAAMNLKSMLDGSPAANRCYPPETIDALLTRVWTATGRWRRRGRAGEGTSVVVDEVSMVDPVQLEELLRVAWKADRIVLVGDPHQLPSIQAGSVLRDLLATRRVKTATLEKVRRTGPGSAIAALARGIRAGQVGRVGDGATFIPVRQWDELVAAVAQQFLDVGNGDNPDVQVISPFRRLNEGINQRVRAMLRGGQQVQRGSFSPGDRLVCNRTIRGHTRIYNGTFGTYIGRSRREAAIAVDGEEVVFDANDLRSFGLGWAATVHKGQGTEWPTVILALPPAADSDFLDRALVYTGVTRASERLFVMGCPQTFRAAVERDYAERRVTLLGQLGGRR